MTGKGKREVRSPHGTGAARSAWGACRRRTAHQGPPPRAGWAHPPCGEISNFSNFSRGSLSSTRMPETATAPPYLDRKQQCVERERAYTACGDIVGTTLALAHV